MSEAKKYTLLKDIPIEENNSNDNYDLESVDSETQESIKFTEYSNSIKVKELRYKNVIRSAIMFVLFYVSLYLYNNHYLNEKITTMSILIISSISSIIFYLFNIFL